MAYILKIAIGINEKLTLSRSEFTSPSGMAQLSKYVRISTTKSKTTDQLCLKNGCI